MLAPLYNNKVALVWRAEWKEKCFSKPAIFLIRNNSLLTVELGLMEKNSLKCPLCLRNNFQALPSNRKVKGSFTSVPVLIVLKTSHGFLSIVTMFFSDKFTKSEYLSPV